MARGHDDVAHSRLLGERDPLGSVELHWIELRGELLVLRAGKVLCVHHPLAVAEQAVDSPVNEHAEAGLLEPLTRFQVLRGGLGESDAAKQENGNSTKHMRRSISPQMRGGSRRNSIHEFFLIRFCRKREVSGCSPRLD